MVGGIGGTLVALRVADAHFEPLRSSPPLTITTGDQNYHTANITAQINEIYYTHALMLPVWSDCVVIVDALYGGGFKRTLAALRLITSPSGHDRCFGVDGPQPHFIMRPSTPHPKGDPIDLDISLDRLESGQIWLLY